MSFAPLSFKAAATLSAYRIVKLSASQTINVATAASDKVFGVTTNDNKDTTQAVPVAVAGIAKVYMNDTCAAGTFITSDNLGQGVPVSVNTAGVYAIGQVLQTVSATGTLADVLIHPMQLQIP